MKRFIHLFFVLIILSLSFGRLGVTPAQAATGPSVTISSSAFNPTNTSPIPVTITFDQPVSGLTLDDLVVGNGTAGNLTGSGEAVSLRYSQISAGDTHTCGLVSDGSARCWGRNNYGQSTVPALGSGLSYTQVSVSPGGYNSTSCGLVSDGSLRCWGYSGYGQTSVPALGSGLTYTQASLSFYHACGLLSNGSVLYWGHEDGGGISHLIVPDSGLIFTQISSGYGHSCALVSDGSVDCWGNLIDDGLTPGGGLTYTQVSSGGIHNCGLVSDGSARCWYMNTYGESTVPALGSGLTYTQVSAGGYHSCGLVSDGSARCWGRNNYGQSTVPALGSGLTYTQVSAGFLHTCSLVSDGSARCWGQNNYGQSTVPALPVHYSSYTLDITPTAPGTVTVDLPANSAQNLDGEGNTAAPQFSIRYGDAVTWIGSVSIASDQSVVAVARPHLGNEVASYIGATAGSTTQYVPMLFKGAFGGTYNAALYLQNVSATAATLSLEFTDSTGAVVYTKTDTLDPHASKGYWLPAETGLPNGFAGGVKVTSDQPILAVGRPHINGQVMTYNGMSSGATSAWLPMFFKNGFGSSYNSALYVQNVTGSSADLSIEYINLDGTVACTDNDTLGANASKGYWSLSVACDTGSLPSGFVGGVKVTSTQDILAVARAHLGTQITTYNGSAAGATSAYLPMLFKNAFSGGSYDAALYLQNVSGSSADVTIEYINNAGAVAATQNVTLAANAISSIWLPTVVGLPDDFTGGARISSTQNVIVIGRPHLGSEITTYNGASAGGLNASLPMLFKDAYGGSYDAAFYVQNTSGSAANVEISFYDSAGLLSCIKSIDLAAGATQSFWMPTVTCTP